jgi:hypothetical protein
MLEKETYDCRLNIRLRNVMNTSFSEKELRPEENGEVCPGCMDIRIGEKLID